MRVPASGVRCGGDALTTEWNAEVPFRSENGPGKVSGAPESIGTALGEGMINPHPSGAMTTTTRPPAHSFTHLLARYISGSVDPEQLDALCDLMETSGATPAERLAFASYFLDAKEEANMPQSPEFVEIVGAARA